MQRVAISPVPNQEFTVSLAGLNYLIAIRSADGFMVYDISIGGQAVVQGFRFVTGELLLPYEYMEQSGNLILDVLGDEEPNYESFGGTQNLFFLNQQEVEQYRANRS